MVKRRKKGKIRGEGRRFGQEKNKRVMWMNPNRKTRRKADRELKREGERDGCLY